MVKKSDSGFSLVELMAVVGIMGLLAVVGVPALRGLQGSGGRKETVGKIMGALELARNTAIASGTNAAVVFPDSSFSPTNYGYRTLAVVQWNPTNPTASATMVGGWIRIPDGVAIFPQSLSSLPTANNVTVLIPPTTPKSGSFRAVIFQADGSLVDPAATNGVAIFEGTVSGGAAQLSKPNTSFETFRIGQYTGRARGTLAPKP